MPPGARSLGPVCALRWAKDSRALYPLSYDRMRFLASDFAFLDRIETWEVLTEERAASKWSESQAPGHAPGPGTYNQDHPLPGIPLPSPSVPREGTSLGFHSLPHACVVFQCRLHRQAIPRSTTSGPILLICTSPSAESNRVRSLTMAVL